MCHFLIRLELGIRHAGWHKKFAQQSGMNWVPQQTNNACQLTHGGFVGEILPLHKLVFLPIYKHTSNAELSSRFKRYLKSSYQIPNTSLIYKALL